MDQNIVFKGLGRSPVSFIVDMSNQTEKIKYMFMFKQRMVVKTITVTEDAYAAVKDLKQEDESFSDLFLRLGKRTLRVKDLAGFLQGTPERAKELREKLKQLRQETDASFEQRMKDVRARFKRANRTG